MTHIEPGTNLFPHTDDVLEHIYPDTDIRNDLETFFRDFQEARTKDGFEDAFPIGLHDFEIIDRIHRSPARKDLSRRIRIQNSEREALFVIAVDAVLEHAAAMQGYTLKDLERTDFREFSFRCAQEKKEGAHHYHRRIIHPVENGTNWERVYASRVQVKKQSVLYRDGKERIKKGKIQCGVCEGPMEGIPLSRMHIIRPPLRDKDIRILVENLIAEAHETIPKRQQPSTKETLLDFMMASICEQYPDVGRPGNINLGELYAVFENITRRNITAEGLFEHLPEKWVDSLVHAVYKHVPAPVCVARSRVKYEMRLLQKLMMYIGREKIYSRSQEYGSEKNPIRKPVDLFGIRNMFKTKQECYQLMTRLQKDKKHFKLFKEYEKNKRKTSGYYQLQLSGVYTTSFGNIPMEWQFRTHTMDKQAEYGNVSQDHDSRKKRNMDYARRSCPAHTEYLLMAIFAPSEYKKISAELQSRGASSVQGALSV